MTKLATENSQKKTCTSKLLCRINETFANTAVCLNQHFEFIKYSYVNAQRN